MWGLSFQIKAPFAHFRNPYTTTFKQSYPFPPKPTIVGIIGAIFGWNEKTVINHTKEFKIAIPFWKHYGKAVEFTYILSVGKIKGKSRVREEFRPERFELLLYPEYQLIILHKEEDIIKKLKERLINHDFEFPLYMGKNEFLITVIKILQGPFQIKLSKVQLPTGIVFSDGNIIPEFNLLSFKQQAPEVFIGVPKSLKHSPKGRIQEEVCVALATKSPIKLKVPLDGIKINESEYTII